MDEKLIPDVQLSIDDIMKATSTNDTSVDDTTNIVDDTTEHNIEEIEDLVTEVDNPISTEDLTNIVQDHISDDDEDENRIVVNEDGSLEKETNEDEEVNPYNVALQFIRENGILNLPNDIDENTLDGNALLDLVSKDQETRNRRALEWVKNRTDDPRMAELFDYTYSGATFEEFTRMKETMEVQTSFDKLDIKQVDDQKFLISEFLKVGLDANNPAHALRLEKVETEAQNYIDRMEGEDLAKQAQDYFINQLNVEKQRLEQEKNQRIAEEQKYEQMRIESEKRWINDFRTSLNQKNWDDSRKDNIISQFNIVELDNGQEVEMWKYKFDKIWENPELTQVFMDFLSDLDPHELKFKSRTPVKKQVTDTIMQMVNKKKDNSRTKQVSTRRKTNTNKSTVKKINPWDQI